MTQGQETPVAAPRRMARRMHDAGPVVAILGAGFSGTMAAIHLRHVLPPDHTVILFDQTGRFARGPAYAATDAVHLLNVRSANMSALPDDPGHFERWLARQAPDGAGEAQVTAAGTFASRHMYGRYLRALLYEEMTRSGGRVRLCADRATEVERFAGKWRVRFASGREVVAVATILALGNLPTQEGDDGVVFHNPWRPNATSGLRPHEPVLIVGTGLTMVDLTLSMQASGFGGPVIALSRRGLVPQPHAAPQDPQPPAVFTEAERRSVPLLLRAVRHRIRQQAALGVGWRTVLDALRPQTAALWQGLPSAERRRFLRHLRPYWDSHRHRMAPASAQAFHGLVDQGTVRIRRGRVRSITIQAGPHGAEAAVSIGEHGRPAPETLVVQRVLYAIGVGPHAVQDSLIAGLVTSGLARMDAHGLGLNVTDGLQVLDRNGERTQALWALGPLVRGVFWECTAVPDIRLQAHRIAQEVARTCGPGP